MSANQHHDQAVSASLSSAGGEPSSFMPTFASQADYSAVVTAIYKIVNLAEFLVYLPTLPIVLFCALIIANTSILHRNLKCILLTICAYVCLFAIHRLYSFAGQLLAGNPFLVPPQWALAVSFFTIVFGNLVGHVLICERILATILVRRYERYEQWHFTVIWMPLVIVLSIVNSYYQIYVLGSLVIVSAITFWTHVVAMIASFAEIFIMSLITYVNARKFRLERTAQNIGELSSRYQLMENIRTGRQLHPTFLCHFLSVVFSFLMIINCRYQILMEINSLALMGALGFLFHSVNNLMIPVSFIVFHPILYRNACNLLRLIRNGVFSLLKLAGSNKIYPSSNTNGNVALTADDGLQQMCPLPINSTIGIHILPGAIPIGHIRNHRTGNEHQVAAVETYFQQLYNSWGDGNQRHQQSGNPPR